MASLLTRNGKMRKTGVNNLTQNSKLENAPIYTVNWGIPALKTCPMADQCKSFCYATKGAYAWPNVKAAQNRRWLFAFMTLAIFTITFIS